MGKGVFIKRTVAVRNDSTNTLMEKNKQRKTEGWREELRIWNFQG